MTFGAYKFDYTFLIMATAFLLFPMTSGMPWYSMVPAVIICAIFGLKKSE